MKKRILIIFIVLIVLAAIILPLYFFVFKKSDLSQQQAINLTTRAAIDIGAIEDFKDSPKLEGFNSDSGENNIIYSKPIPSLNDIVLTESASDENSPAYVASVEDFKNTASFCSRFLRIEGIEQNKIYKPVDESNFITFSIINNEVIFIIVDPAEEGFYVVSFFYDSVYNEYEYVVSSYTKVGENFSCNLKRFKANSKSLLSYESYSLSNITNKDILVGIDNGEGQSEIKIIDYKNKVEKNISLDKAINADDHFILSSYVYTIHTNVFNHFEDTKKAIKEVKEPLNITFSIEG